MTRVDLVKMQFICHGFNPLAFNQDRLISRSESAEFENFNNYYLTEMQLDTRNIYFLIFNNSAASRRPKSIFF